MSLTRMLGLIALSLAALVFPAKALEVSEIVQLKQGGVQDEVIMNIVRNNRFPGPLTQDQVMMLASGGLSQQLMAFLTGPEAYSYGGMGVQASVTATQAALPRTFPETTYPDGAYQNPPSGYAIPPYQSGGGQPAAPIARAPMPAAPPVQAPQPRAPALVSQSMCLEPGACDDAPIVVQAPTVVRAPTVVVAPPRYYAAPAPYYYPAPYYGYSRPRPYYYGGGWRGPGFRPGPYGPRGRRW